MKTLAGYLLTGTALLACPCHLGFVLPLVLGLFSGTALGAALAMHTGLIIGVATVYFLGALATGLYILTRLAIKGGKCRQRPHLSENQKRKR